MSGGQPYRNPWAETLSQVSLPDGGESWKAMEVLLDREMPQPRARDWRRWLLLILLLLLLIGVCNCPGRKWLLSRETKVEQGQADGPAAGKENSRGEASGGNSGERSSGGTSGERALGGQARGGPSAGSAAPVRETGQVRSFEPVRESEQARRSRPVSVKGTPQRVSRVRSAPADSARDLIREGRVDGAETKGEARNKDKERKDDERKDKERKNDEKKDKESKDKGKKDGGKKDEEQKDGEKTGREHGWMIGIGLNQFFTVGGQQASSFNSSGLTGTLGDYIPVPMVRYYFSPRLYVQLEAQINTPQYTKKNLVAVQTKIDSLTPVQTVQRSVSINKLFYFNVPVSVHYTVIDHLDVGAGLQYSRLTNGIGVFNSNYNNGGSDSLATETKSFKGDSVYREIRTHEFRFLVDANYTWKHFVLGIRYNEALSKFIHVEIQPGQITQARNSSLQLYLRYILWDGRKKKDSSAPK